MELPCSPDYPTSSVNWYTVRWDGAQFVRQDFFADGNRTAARMSGEGNFSLTVNELRERDANFYCCGNATDQAGYCWFYRTELHVTGAPAVSHWVF